MKISCNMPSVMSYYSRIKSLLNVLDVDKMIEPVNSKSEIKTNSKVLSKYFAQLHISHFHERMGSDEKYAFYDSLKFNYAKEKYLTFINNPELRKSMSLLRCGFHYFPVNYFRYRSSVGQSNTCFLCNLKRGDEEHALLECSYLNDLCTVFFRQNVWLSETAGPTG